MAEDKYVVWEIVANDEHELSRKLNEFAGEGFRVVSVVLAISSTGLRALQDRYMVILERQEKEGEDG